MLASLQDAGQAPAGGPGQEAVLESERKGGREGERRERRGREEGERRERGGRE